MWQINRPPSSTKPSSTEQLTLTLTEVLRIGWRTMNKCKRSMIYKHNKEQMQVINDLQTQDCTDTLSNRDPSSIDLLISFFLETVGSILQWSMLITKLRSNLKVDFVKLSYSRRPSQNARRLLYSWGTARKAKLTETSSVHSNQQVNLFVVFLQRLDCCLQVWWTLSWCRGGYG